MSWNLDIAAKSKQGAKDAVLKKAAEPHSLPFDIATLICSKIDEMSNSPDFGFRVVSSGHLGNTGGNGSFQIGYTQIVD